MSSHSEIINFDFMSEGGQKMKGGAKQDTGAKPLNSEERNLVRENISNLLNYIFE